MSEPGDSVAPLTITLFGPLSVLVGGQPIPHLRSRKAQWLLALLTLRHGKPVQREWLAGTLWPDVDQTQAFANLRPALSELRKALGSEGARLQSPSRNSLLLDLAGAEVDALTFDAAIARKTPSDLEQAISLYHGILLEGCTEEWVAQDREMRHQECLRSLQTLATAAAEAGKHETAADYWRRAVGLDPLWEAARRGLMEALARGGDSNEALDVYRTFVRQLRRDDPKAAPDPETTALYTRLLASVRRRADRAAAQQAEAPTVPAVTGYLPHALTPLVGREDERLEVAALLQRSRLVTLTGPGGIGKTRLAIEVASEVVGDYKDGVWLVPLDALTEGTRVIGQIASVLPVKETSSKTILKSVVEFLHGKRLLLVLDNCEHVLRSSLEVAGHLLGECAGLRILATSREAMGITGETVWAVPPLAVPELDHLPQGRASRRDVLLSYDSVKLFVERAQAVQKTFTLTAENAPSIARLCASLEGIPLAIELAAGRVRALTVEQIAKHLADHLGHSGPLGHLRLLTGGSRSASHRQQTLRGTLDWSFDLLSEAERTLLPRLAVFAGGWGLEAAEEVCTDGGIEREDVLDLLSSLADKSLVVFGRADTKSEGRFLLLEMVRQYSAEKLAQSGSLERIRMQHRDWYLALAEQAKPEYKGANQQFWLERVETEHDNVRAALQCCAEGVDQNSIEAGLRLASALWGFWEIRGYIAEGCGHLERALAQDNRQTLTVFRARTLGALSAVSLIQTDFVAAQTYCEEALSIFRHLGDLTDLANTTNRLASIAFAQRQCESAKALFEESLSYRRHLNDRHGIALALNNVGIVTLALGDLDAATALYEESLQIRRDLGDTRGIAYAVRSLGTVANARGDYAMAQARHEEALLLRRELGDIPGIAESLLNLGVNAIDMENYAASLELYEEALSLYRKLGHRIQIAGVLGNLANLHYVMKNYSMAWVLNEESLSLRREMKEPYGTAISLLGMAQIALKQGEAVRAEALLREGLLLFTELEEKEGIAEGLRVYGWLNLEKQNTAKAVRLFGAAEGLYKSSGIVVAPPERRGFDQQIEMARTAAGKPVFTSEWERGRALTWEQATAYALEETVAVAPQD